MDFRTILPNCRFGVRVTALILKQNKLLTYKVDDQFHLIGGAIEVGEDSEKAIFREVKEELGLTCRINNLMFVVENKFKYNNELHHMIEFHYKVEITENPPQYTLDDHHFECVWLDLKDIANYDLRPAFLKKKLIQPQSAGNIEHIVINKL